MPEIEVQVSSCHGYEPHLIRALRLICEMRKASLSSAQRVSTLHLPRLAPRSTVCSSDWVSREGNCDQGPAASIESGTKSKCHFGESSCLCGQFWRLQCDFISRLSEGLEGLSVQSRSTSGGLANRENNYGTDAGEANLFGCKVTPSSDATILDLTDFGHPCG